MDNERFSSLSRCRIFKGLSGEEIHRLLRRVAHGTKHFPKGKMVACRGERCENLHILTRGEIRGEMMDGTGKALEIETLQAPREIAPAFVFGQYNLFPVDIITNSPASILKIPRSSLLILFQLSRGILSNFLDLISNKTFFLSERLYFLTFKTIKEKFGQYLLNLRAKSESSTIILPKSISELSEYFAVSRPALSRVIGELVREGTIEQNRRQINIKNLAGLTVLDQE